MIEPNKEYTLKFELPRSMNGKRVEEIQEALCKKAVLIENPPYGIYSFEVKKSDSPSRLSIITPSSSLEEKSGKIFIPEGALVELEEIDIKRTPFKNITRQRRF